MIVSHGIDSSMVHRRQCSFWESSRFDCSEAACRIRPFGVEMAFPQFSGYRVNVFEPLAAPHKQPDSRSLTSSVDDVDCRSTRCN
jgi:hypothetical protein